MKAAYISQPGGPEMIQYGDLPDPIPSGKQVLVKVGAVSVNPIDTYIRAGNVKMNIPSPYVIGCDLAGTVVKCGGEVSRFREGDRVWGSNQGLFGRQGTFGELAAVDEEWLYPTPEKETDIEAAAGALVGLTAHLGLFLHAELKPGEVVFVNGGTGGVGSAVVQVAKAAGARVIATVGSEEKAELCKRLGADQVVNYRTANVDEEIKRLTADNGGIDLWWETQREPTFDRTIGLMKRRGRIVLMAGRDARPQFPVGPFYVNELWMCGFAMFNATPQEQRYCAEEMNRWYESGSWKPLVGPQFSLKDAAEAHRLQEANTIGKQGTLTGKIVLVP